MSEKIVQLNEEVIKGQIKELVRGSVEETLNELLEAEAEKLTQAARYERNEQRQGYRSGHYNRNLTTTSGDVTLKVPKLKGISFETAIIERYRRRESSVEEALIEMYLAGVSVRRVEDITEALWGSKVSPSTISELNKKAYVHIEDWRNRPLQGGRYPYVPAEFMGVKLFTEDKKRLCEALSLRQDDGKKKAWPSTKKALINDGYTITEGRQNSKYYAIITR